MNMTFAQADPIKVQKRKVKQENLRENFYGASEHENKKDRKVKMEEKRQKKPKPILKGKNSLFLSFYFL